MTGPLRFDPANHRYTVGGQRVISITQLLTVSGEVDDSYFTVEGSERGTAVHKLAADYDMGAVDLATDGGVYRPYLLAYAKAMSLLPHEWSHIEEMFVSRPLRFAGTPDRVGIVRGAVSVLDIKTGPFSKSHQIQTALQAILVADEVKLPPELVQRYVAYAMPSGKFKVEFNTDPRDFSKARDLIQRFAR